MPITHVTNGVHAETWVGPEFAALYRARLGDGYGTRTDGWERLAAVTDEELLAARTRASCDSSTRCAAAWHAQPTERGDDPRDLAWQADGARSARRSRSASRGASRPTSG